MNCLSPTGVIFHLHDWLQRIILPPILKSVVQSFHIWNKNEHLDSPVAWLVETNHFCYLCCNNYIWHEINAKYKDNLKNQFLYIHFHLLSVNTSPWGFAETSWGSSLLALVVEAWDGNHGGGSSNHRLFTTKVLLMEKIWRTRTSWYDKLNIPYWQCLFPSLKIKGTSTGWQTPTPRFGWKLV